jgi:hypothetical protein
MDYLVIGSNGFAQVGDPEYFEKNKAEMKVLLEYLKKKFPLPEEFSHMCDYRVKWFSHDFGRYSEIVLIYDDYILSQWDEDNLDKFNRFRDWFNGIEAIDLESDYLNKAIEARYQEFIGNKKSAVK